MGCDVMQFRGYIWKLHTKNFHTFSGMNRAYFLLKNIIYDYLQTSPYLRISCLK
jgi:hypothetical protein